MPLKDLSGKTVYDLELRTVAKLFTAAGTYLLTIQQVHLALGAIVIGYRCRRMTNCLRQSIDHKFRYVFQYLHYTTPCSMPNIVVIIMNMFITSVTSPVGTDTWATCPSMVPIAGSPYP